MATLTLIGSKLRTHLFAMAMVFAPVSAILHGQTIDFELLPDGRQTQDGQTISDQYEMVYGVCFQLERGTYPVIAKVGPPQTAFQGPGGQADQPAPGTNLGTSFLTDDGIVGGPPSPLIVKYTSPVAAASGVLVDIDNTEEWLIEAYDVNDVVIAAVQLVPGAGDGGVTFWSFSNEKPLIQSIKLSYTGDNGFGVGLAFDNFSPAFASVPLDVSVTSSPWNKICLGESVELTAQLIGGVPPYEFLWEQASSDGKWLAIGKDQTITVAPSANSSYRVTVTDSDDVQKVSEAFDLPVCGTSADFDGDGDVDLIDYGVFQRMFTGATR